MIETSEISSREFPKRFEIEHLLYFAFSSDVLTLNK